MDYERYYRFGPFTVRVDFYRGPCMTERDWQVRRGNDGVRIRRTCELGHIEYHVSGRCKKIGLHLTWKRNDGLSVATWHNCPSLVIE